MRLNLTRFVKSATTKGRRSPIYCDDEVIGFGQAETDRLWSALLSGGGKESMCGWLTDRFGISWQIVPEVLPRLFNDPDTAAASRARAAMMQMKKIDIAALEAAFHAA
jgi:predicted 3-demethylubiquinone-9 3-methyltransferase (glyoxalase superfamily)